MYAVIESGGKQYRVAPGDVIRVETLTAEIGDVGDFGRVLAVSQDDGKLLVGKAAAGAKVEATIIRNGRAKKILVFHFKRKKQYKKTQGHRQNFTEVKVERITV
ncbi:MAG: 50S ribosomal protein L21 [Acidobacteria bacterium RIFCSPLOWO2_12_FULL_54_10]|nr:MAG: 50S ribosomal protein L21 [Acidobacteria bacterium RIFCSPLOWO2_12_FULL_54_10]